MTTHGVGRPVQPSVDWEKEGRIEAIIRRSEAGRIAEWLSEQHPAIASEIERGEHWRNRWRVAQ